jgi:hypothetical protein
LIWTVTHIPVIIIIVAPVVIIIAIAITLLRIVPEAEPWNFERIFLAHALNYRNLDIEIV